MACFTFTLPVVADTGSSTRSGTSSASTRTSRRERGETGERVRALAVDDDPNGLRYVGDALIAAGYAPVVTGGPQEALRLVEEEKPALMLLDLMLPVADGIELMQEILDVADVAVIFFSAYGRDELIATAFSMGAVDYVVKPFSPTELTARIAAALRQREVPDPSEPYAVGGLTIDYAERRVTSAGEPVDLLRMEYRMLAEFSAGAGRTLSYEHLLDRVWRERSGGGLRPMRTVLRRLRIEAGRRRGQPRLHLHLHRAPGGVQDGRGGDIGRRRRGDGLAIIRGKRHDCYNL